MFIHWNHLPGQTTKVRQPWISETKPAVLATNFYTPNDEFYVRNHTPVPIIQVSELPDYEVTFTRGNDEDAEGEALTLDKLKEKFEQVTITSILQGAIQ